jgi:hypothetical protein
MAYYFGLGLDTTVFVKQFENSQGVILPWREISQAPRFDEENSALLPDVIRVELYSIFPKC